jgi:hypothetical protein
VPASLFGWLSLWPALEISSLGVIVSAKKHRFAKCERTRQSSFCAHLRSTQQGEEIMNRLPPMRATNLNSSLSSYNPIQ